MAYKHGRFVWCELVTPNPDDGIAFWTEVAGFTVANMKMPDGGDYRTLQRAGKTVGGVVVPRMDGVPPEFYPPGGTKEESWRTLFYANLTASFITEILSEGDENEGSFMDGARVQEVINAVEQSFRERRWVTLPLPR